MRPPEFWTGRAEGRDAAPVLQLLLAPVAFAYSWAAARRYASVLPRHASVPVVCIGNLTVGGAGKTPVARAVREVLGASAHMLSRGYGGKLEGPLRVTTDMAAHEVGDEPLLHAKDGPAWIAQDRVKGAHAIALAGAHAIVMDDGFQNPSLAKDLSIIVVDAAYGVGNGKVFPAGPLRERLEAGLARADAIVLLRAAEGADETQSWMSEFKKPVLGAELIVTAKPPEGPLVAFAGIARPEKFFSSLEAAGADMVEAVPYADHHEFTESDLEWLDRLAAEREARLITTEKDLVRLPAEMRARVATLPVSARFDDATALETLLAPIRARMG